MAYEPKHNDELRAPPRPTGQVVGIKLDGALLMWRHGQPVPVIIAGLGDLCVPMFSSKETLERAAVQFRLAYESIKQVTDGFEFLDSTTAQGFRVILDPRLTDAGKVRYFDVTDVKDPRGPGR